MQLNKYFTKAKDHYETAMKALEDAMTAQRAAISYSEQSQRRAMDEMNTADTIMSIAISEAREKLHEASKNYLQTTLTRIKSEQV